MACFVFFIEGSLTNAWLLTQKKKEKKKSTINITCTTIYVWNNCQWSCLVIYLVQQLIALNLLPWPLDHMHVFTHNFNRKKSQPKNSLFSINKWRKVPTYIFKQSVFYQNVICWCYSILRKEMFYSTMHLTHFIYGYMM